LAETLSEQSWITRVMDVHTNIVVAQVNSEKTVAEVVDALAQKDVHAMPFGEDTIRMVTHLDNTSAQISYVREVIEKI
ncbi:MAG: hypothetical protein ACQERC_12530, partial [Bacteroidota bacterium]